MGTCNICIRDMALLKVQKPIAGSNPARPDSDCGELIEIFEELKGAGYGRISRHPGRSGWVGVGADY